jgi:hypothetical protein
MAKTRFVFGAAIAGLLLYALPPPAAADGLGRFEQAIKDAQKDGQMPPGALTYKSAKSLGDSGFVLDDVVLTPPPDATPGAKAEPVAIKRVTVEDFDFAAIDKKAPPAFVKLRIEGIAIGAKPVAGVDLAELAGIDKITCDFQLDYRLDPEHKTLTLNRLELDLPGLARLELSMVLDGVSADQLGKPGAAMTDATLRTATLTFEDRSLLSKVVPAAAKMQGSDADAFVSLGAAMLGGMRNGQGPAALAVIDALVSYMNDYKHPQGPLRITLNPPGKTSFTTAMADIKTPDDAVKALGVVVSYAGTKPGAPAAAKNASPSPADAAAAAASAATKAAAPK